MSDLEYEEFLPEFFTCKRCGLPHPMKDLKEVMIKDLLYPVNWCKNCFEDVISGKTKVSNLQTPPSPGETEQKDGKVKVNKSK